MNYSKLNAQEMSEALMALSRCETADSDDLLALDAAAYRWASRRPELMTAWRTFSSARRNHVVGPDNWSNLTRAAEELSRTFAPLGSSPAPAMRT